MRGEVIRGPSGEKIGHYTSVNAVKVGEDMATGTWIRWLIGKDDAPTFSMRLFEVEVDGHIKAHRHPWEHEIFILKGKGRIRINNRLYDVGEGYYIYIPPNVEHEYWNIGDSKLVFLCMIPNKPTT